MKGLSNYENCTKAGSYNTKPLFLFSRQNILHKYVAFHTISHNEAELQPEGEAPAVANSGGWVFGGAHFVKHEIHIHVEIPVIQFFNHMNAH